MSFDAGTIVGHLTLEKGSFTQGILQSQALSEAFGHTITNFIANPLVGVVALMKEAAAASVNWGKTAVEKTADVAHETIKLSEKVGISTDTVQALAYAGRLAGLDMEGLGHSLAFLARNTAEAAEGHGPQAEMFARLGLNARDAAGHTKGVGEILPEVADALAATADQSDRVRIAMELFSRGGAQMLPVLQKGRQGLDDMATAARNVGAIMSREALEGANAFFGAMKKLDEVYTAVQVHFGIPIAREMAKALEELGQKAGPDAAKALAAIDAFSSEIGKDLGAIAHDAIPLIVQFLKDLPGMLAEIKPLLKDVTSFVHDVMPVLGPIVHYGMAAQALSMHAQIPAIIGRALEPSSGGAFALPDVLKDTWFDLRKGPHQTAPEIVPVSVTVHGEASAHEVAKALAPALSKAVKGTHAKILAATRRNTDLERFTDGIDLR